MHYSADLQELHNLRDTLKIYYQKCLRKHPSSIMVTKSNSMGEPEEFRA